MHESALQDYLALVVDVVDAAGTDYDDSPTAMHSEQKQQRRRRQPVRWQACAHALNWPVKQQDLSIPSRSVANRDPSATSERKRDPRDTESFALMGLHARSSSIR